MKNLKKYFFLFTTFVSLISCETLDLNKIENPNFLNESQQEPNLLINAIQLNFVRQIEGNADYDSNENFQSGGATNGDGLSLFGKQITRLVALTSSKQYSSVYQGSDSDDEWINAYVGILSNIRALAPLAEESGLSRHLAVSQFIEAYVISSLVDFYGDIPYSQGLLGLDNLNPETESGDVIYQNALSLLDESIVNFNNETSAEPDFDPFYGRDYELWTKAANSLKIKLYNQMRLVGNSAATDSIQSIIGRGEYILNERENFEFIWPATSASLPDTRHPRFGLNYTATGAEDYMSNWLMNLMETSSDPRIRYYFYRQTDCTPGASCSPDGNEETLNCSLQNSPQHYVVGDFTFCYLDNGYWGRDHMDDGGTPPDGFLRTTYGVYPVGGNFDDDRFKGVTTTSASGGAGVTPILTASWIDFTIAELALTNNNTTMAKTHLESALQKHIEEVQTYISKDPIANSDFEPTEIEVKNYIDQIGTNFESASLDGKWNILGEQFLISCFANGIEAYNFYRRTGFPTTLQPGRDPEPGGVIRSLFYPTDAVNTNSSISQKSDVQQPVFWDTNTSGPAAN